MRQIALLWLSLIHIWASILFSLVVAIPLGMLAGYKRDTVLDKIISVFNYLGISVPSFWFGIMLIILFSSILHWLPSSGMRTTGVNLSLIHI